jgi:hypothetical protein
MGMGKVAIVVLTACLAIGGGIAALTDSNDDAPVGAIELDAGVPRRDDADDEIAGGDEGDDRDKDGDRTDGNDGTGGANNTGDVTYDAPAGSFSGGDTT